MIEALARGLLRGYDARWRHANSEIVLHNTEIELASPLFNVNTGRRSRTFTLTGIIDKLAGENDGSVVIYDHKTTSMPIADPTDIYWRQLAVESQPSHYSLLAGLNGMQVSRVIWDVVRKPSIRPKQLTKAQVAELNEHGTYFSQAMPEETLEAIANGNIHEGEDPQMALFEARVYWETYNDPDKYFARRSVTRLNDEIGEYATELWEVADAVREARNKGAWYRNADSCMQYNTPCEFLGICSGADHPDSDRWKSDPREKNVLSASRLKCFQSCRRKYYYRYERQITQVDKEQTEPIRFGKLWHEMLDFYWSQHSQAGESYVNDSEAVEAERSDIETGQGLPG